jgi:3-isopropylmalate/(R)-2-methylmalate dehydratase small subunit
MDKFTTHTGRALPLRRSNVDTDQIIPAVYLKRITRTGFEDGLFAAWRADPEFILNQEEYQGVSVLVAGPDFGTGSSREHAVWALKDYGFKVVLSARFADIFRGNSAKDGLLTAVLKQDDIEILWKLLEENPELEVTVDLEALIVRFGTEQVPCVIREGAREALRRGEWDAIGLLLEGRAEVAKLEASLPYLR